MSAPPPPPDRAIKRQKVDAPSYGGYCQPTNHHYGGQFPIQPNSYMSWQPGAPTQTPYAGQQPWNQGHSPMGMPGRPAPPPPANWSSTYRGPARSRGPPPQHHPPPPQANSPARGKHHWGGSQQQWQGYPPPPPHAMYGHHGPPPPQQQQHNMPQHMQTKLGWGRGDATRPRASPEGFDDNDMYISEKKSGDKGRGSYRCGRCGAPKKGHVCPYQPKLKRRPDEPPPEMRNAAVQVEMDEFMTLRRLNIEIQGYPESYASAPVTTDSMVHGEPHQITMERMPHGVTPETEGLRSSPRSSPIVETR